MAWTRGDGDGLPRFQQLRPPGSPSLALRRGPSLNSELSLEAGHSLNGLAHAYSCETQRSTEEEEELSRELLADLGITGERAQDGAAGPCHSRSQRSSRRTSRRASEALASSGSDGGAAGAGQSGAAGVDDEEEEWQAGEEEEEEELQPSLYDQLGGGVVVKVVVDGFYRRVLGDEELGRFFVGVDMSKHTTKFLLFVTFVLGGPDEYLQLHPEPWPALYSVHEKLIREQGLTEAHFERVKVHFSEALKAVGAPQLLIDYALAVVESTRRIMFPLQPPPPSQEQAAAAAREEEPPTQAARRSVEAAMSAARAGASPLEFEI